MNEKEIVALIGEDSYKKGKTIDKYEIDYIGPFNEGILKCNMFDVLSQSGRNSYYVCIYTNSQTDKITKFKCECLQFSKMNTCKHIGAVMFHNMDILVKNPIAKEEKNKKLSKDILKEFYTPVNKNEIKLKKELNLDIEIEFSSSHSMIGEIKLKIGEDRLYNLNNKANQFLSAYNTQKNTVTFGKNFTYNPSLHYFNKKDKEIIDYIFNKKNYASYFSYQYFIIKPDNFEALLKVIKGKQFILTRFGHVKDIKEENPIKVKMTKEEEAYQLKPLLEDIKFLPHSFKYAYKDDTLYILSDKLENLIKLMKTKKLDSLIFDEKDLNLYIKGIFPIFEDNIILEENLKDKITFGVKPDIKLYLDFKDGIIFCDIKLTYNENEINYFDNTEIIRDEETEEKLIRTLLSFGFNIKDNYIYIDDLDIIGEFLENNLNELAKLYEVFTSTKIKNTKIITETNVKSNFGIGEDNILSYTFDLNGIKEDELVNILDSLKSKKKYYKLKSGDIINLDEDDSLKELSDLTLDLGLKEKDIKNGSGQIPKYRAIYLSSLKKDKYHIINTNNLFDNLIENFTSYKNQDIKFLAKDKKILRDYQITGIKWLNNIYKCGFGGILADEMGLGKSIQLIYFIKNILKEKSDAKILIVAPTSLVYNWKNEFDKFGNDLNYTVLAENRKTRRETLHHLENTNILITTYGLIREDKEEYFKMNFELLAIDEAQNIKNVAAQMTKIVKEVKANTKIALTGTPLENSVLELWSIFDFIMPGYLANIDTFKRKYNVKDVDEENLKLLNNLKRQIEPFILRRKKKDVLTELPDKIENNIYIDLNKEQKKIYITELEKTKKELDEIIRTEGFKKGNFKILMLLTKLRQICIDPSIVYENYKSGSSKIEELIKMTKNIIENGHKILLFSSFKSAIDIVNREFTNESISTYVIDGSVKAKTRMELVDKFNSDETNVFLITLKSGGTGLNLTSADVVIHLDLWWNPQVENQATDRAHRIGQKNTVEVIKLICKGTIEERILELQTKKKILSDNLIEGDNIDTNILSKLTEKDIRDLLSMDNEED